jgi:hypothetical protein
MAALIILVEKCQPKIEVLDTSDYATPIGCILRLALFQPTEFGEKATTQKGTCLASVGHFSASAGWEGC